MFEQLEANAAEIAALTSAGAHIMGRNMFGPGRGALDESWRGWWGENPPYHAPVVVLSHPPRDPLTMQGGTTFTFVTEGIEAALAQARAAAGTGTVAIAGGAATVKPVPRRRADRRSMAAHRPGHPRRWRTALRRRRAHPRTHRGTAYRPCDACQIPGTSPAAGPRSITNDARQRPPSPSKANVTPNILICAAMTEPPEYSIDAQIGGSARGCHQQVDNALRYVPTRAHASVRGGMARR